MFASKTPRDLNHDPQPFVGADGSRKSRYSRFAPREDWRAEFDHVQHNEPNPILRTLRTLDRDWTARFAAVELFDQANGLAWLAAGAPNDEPGSRWWDFETHASRVIERIHSFATMEVPA